MMSDSGKQVGDCEHGIERGNCVRCLRTEVADLRREVRRLKRGDFTPGEFQALCHHRDERPGCTPADFADGCLAYQCQLFGLEDTAKQTCRLAREMAEAASLSASATLARSNALEEVDG